VEMDSVSDDDCDEYLYDIPQRTVVLRCKRSVNTNIALLKKPIDALNLFYDSFYETLTKRTNEQTGSTFEIDALRWSPLPRVQCSRNHGSCWSSYTEWRDEIQR